MTRVEFNGSRMVRLDVDSASMYSRGCLTTFLNNNVFALESEVDKTSLTDSGEIVSKLHPSPTGAETYANYLMSQEE